MALSHRQLVYDPDTSTRKFKRFQNKACGDALYQAYLLGEYYGSKRKNPYPAGRRHDEYERGAQLNITSYIKYKLHQI